MKNPDFRAVYYKVTRQGTNLQIITVNEASSWQQRALMNRAIVEQDPFQKA